jgi:hypothetical protein
MNSLIALAAAAAYLDLGSNVSLGDDEPEDDDDLDDGAEEVEAAPKAAKKKVKKGGKKVKKGGVEKKASSKSDSKGDKNVVRLKDLAKQAKLTEAVCRKKLREAEVPRGEGRWSWDLGSKSLKAARKALGLSVG